MYIDCGWNVMNYHFWSSGKLSIEDAFYIISDLVFCVAIKIQAWKVVLFPSDSFVVKGPVAIFTPSG
jgi:hypothetical protein